MGERVLAAIAAMVATGAVYAAATLLYRRSRQILLNPVLVSVAVLIALLRLSGIEYADYARGGRIIAFFLGPAVVALGVPLHQQMHEIARRGRAIVASVLLGSVVGILAATLPAALLGAPPEVVRTLAARSVTTPIAMAIVAPLGGIPPLAAAVSIGTGILGAVIGPPLLRRCGVRSRTAYGLALGAAAHGLGTARAVEEGPVEGATSGIAIGLMGIATALLAPLLVELLSRAGVIR